MLIATFIRIMVLYALVLFAVRLMGKAELSKLSPFQIITLFMLSELATLPMEDNGIPLIYGVSTIISLIFIQIIFSFITIKSSKFENLINGMPSILIDNGQINKKAMAHLRVSIGDLTEQLRIKGYASISDVAYAILESNGELSVIPKPDKRNATPSDLGLKVPHEVLPVVIVNDGYICKEALKRIGWTEQQLLTIFSKNGFDSVSSIFLAFCDSEMKIHIYTNSDHKTLLKEVII